MSQLIINTKAGAADSLKSGAAKINSNFTELYSLSLPSLIGNSGKYLTTDGNLVSWQPFQATNGVVTTAAYSDPAWITSLNYSKLINTPNLGIYLTAESLSVRTSIASGNGALSYSGGQFTYTPPVVPTYTINTASPAGTGSLSISGSVFTYTPPNVSSLISLTSLSVINTTPSGVGGISYNSSTGLFTFVPPAATTTITGNAGTATALQTARTINGVSFDGTANITVPATTIASSLTTLPTTVINSSLQTVGTLSGLNVTGNTVITGNLTVTGTTTSTSTSTLSVANKTIIVSNGSTSSALSDGSGLQVYGPTPNPTFLYTHANTSFTSNIPIVASTFTGNLTGNVTGNLTGNVTGNVSGTAGTITGIYSGTLTTGQITSALGFTPIQLSSLSVGVNAAANGSGAISYASGVFTYTPPNLSTYLNINSLSITTNAASGTGALSYLNGVFSFTPPNLSTYLTGITGNQVTTALGYTPLQSTSLSVLTNTASGGGSLSYSGGVFTFTPASVPSYSVSTSPTANGGGSLSLNGTTFLFTPASIPTYNVQTNSASGSGALGLSGYTFTYTPPLIPTVPTYTVTSNTASGNGSLSLSGNTFSFTPALVPTYTVSSNTPSGNGALSLNGSVFSFTPPVIPVVPTYTVTTNSASGGGALSISGNTFFFTPAAQYSLPTATTSVTGGVKIPAVGTSGITNTTGTIGLATASDTQLGGVKVDNSTITIASGIISVATASTTVRGAVKIDGTTISINGNGQLTSSGAGLSSRTTVSGTTASIAYQASENVTVQAAKGYALYSIQASAGAWVTIYTSASAQSADSTRAIITDPTPGSGVIAETITTGAVANTTYFTPAVMGFNADGTPGTNMYLKIYNNNSAGATAITVTITYLKLEA
jgi:hypothetical protein